MITTITFDAETWRKTMGGMRLVLDDQDKNLSIYSAPFDGDHKDRFDRLLKRAATPMKQGART